MWDEAADYLKLIASELAEIRALLDEQRLKIGPAYRRCPCCLHMIFFEEQEYHVAIGEPNFILCPGCKVVMRRS
jgi:hypothetical protein